MLLAIDLQSSLIDQTAHTNNVQPTIEVNPKQMDIIERLNAKVGKN